jgi:hypothetical protein
MRWKYGLLAFVLLLLAWVVGLGCWPFIIWSPLNCQYQEVDIKSGRIRYQQYLVGLCVHERVEDTTFSRLVRPNDDGPPAEWHVVNTFSPLVRYSPHHRYHGAIYQIALVEGMLGLARFTPAAQQQLAKNVLQLWQHDGSYSSASAYLEKVEPLVERFAGSPRTIDVADLPPTDLPAK